MWSYPWLHPTHTHTMMSQAQTFLWFLLKVGLHHVDSYCIEYFAVLNVASIGLLIICQAVVSGGKSLNGYYNNNKNNNNNKIGQIVNAVWFVL